MTSLVDIAALVRLQLPECASNARVRPEQSLNAPAITTMHCDRDPEPHSEHGRGANISLKNGMSEGEGAAYLWDIGQEPHPGCELPAVGTPAWITAGRHQLP